MALAGLASPFAGAEAAETQRRNVIPPASPFTGAEGGGRGEGPPGGSSVMSGGWARPFPEEISISVKT